jgi:hypothetical protein
MPESVFISFAVAEVQHKAVLLTCAGSIPLSHLALFPFHMVAGAQGVKSGSCKLLACICDAVDQSLSQPDSCGSRTYHSLGSTRGERADASVLAIVRSPSAFICTIVLCATQTETQHHHHSGGHSVTTHSPQFHNLALSIFLTYIHSFRILKLLLKPNHGPPSTTQPRRSSRSQSAVANHSRGAQSEGSFMSI